MKRIVFALVTLATLSATPAVAGTTQGVAEETNDGTRMMTSPFRQSPFLGQYQVYGSRVAQGEVPEGRPSDNRVRIVPYPAEEQSHDRGR